MNTQLSPKSSTKRSRKNRTRDRRRRHLSLQTLQSRDLMAADFSWDGDVLRVVGSESDDYIAVQTSQLGTQVATDDGFVSEFAGRSVDSAAAIEVLGGGGNDMLFSYQSPVPVSLMGGEGNDFLFSDNLSDVLDGGEGSDWVYSQVIEGTLENAFGIQGLDLDPSSFNGIPQIDENNLIRLQVEVGGEADIAGTPVEIEGLVDVSKTGIDVELGGHVATWDDAFGIPGFDLTDTRLTIGAGHDTEDGNSYRVALQSSYDADGATISIDGAVEIAEESVAAEFTGSVSDWDDAFGINGLDLQYAELHGSGSVDAADNKDLGIAIHGDMLLDSTVLDIDGEFSLSPDRIEGTFGASVANWENAFGITGLTLTDSELNINAFTDRADNYGVHVDLLAEMLIEEMLVDVSGSVDIAPERVDAQLRGSVDYWDDAFGIDGLLLSETDLEVIATSDRVDASDFQMRLTSEMNVTGKDVSVEGTIAIAEDGIEGSLTGTVYGEWAAAMGVVGLHLHDTTLSVRAAKDDSGSELEFGVAAGMDLWGTTVTVDGSVAVMPQGTSASLTGSIAGDWVDAFGISALQMRDTELTIASDATAGNELSLTVDTDLQLFGGYVDVIGDIALGAGGPVIEFSPPVSYDFVDLLGIPGFTLDDTRLGVTAGLDGITVAIDSTMDMGSINVGFTGAFAIGTDEVSATLTGRVDHWDNAFDVAGLNLDDIVMTLGAESGPAGASMFIGLGAGIHIGDKEIDVAGLIGVGSTGWEVAFRGDINSLTSDDLVAFANTITQAGDPNAASIPPGALGDFELKDAYINFAPKGGNADLGIADGFGIGGDFYDDGEMLAEGEFEVDLEQFCFEVMLEIPEFDLGPVDLSDVVIDIRIAANDSYFKVAGTAELMGAEVQVAGEINGDGSFLVMGTANLNIEAMSATATFTIDNSGISFEASANGAVVNAIVGSVTEDLMAVFNGVQEVIDHAQDVVDAAKAGVRHLEADLAEARAEAQREVDEIKSNIASAKSVVDSIGANKNYWYKVRSSRYNAWRSAVSNTKNAAWYNYAYYKGIEATKYASYVAAAGTYSTRVVAYNSALATYNGIKAAAGWALDTAGVEANPDVIRIKALLATAKAAVFAAETVLDEVEEINSDVMQFLDVVDSLHVDRIMLSGKVETLGSAAIHAEVDFSFAGKHYSFGVEADTDKLVEQLAGRLASAIL